jgi:diguanylate cyclase (GGDEF)-like protein
MAARLPQLTLTSRFFAALAVLLVTLAGVGVLAYTGLVQVEQANDQVYTDNFRTAQVTSKLGISLAQVETLALRIVASPDARGAIAMRTELDQVEIPAARTLVARLMAIHRDDDAAEHAKIARIPREWQAFLGLRENGPLAREGVVDAAERSADASRVVASLDPLVRYVVSLQPREDADAAAAHERATDVFESSERWLFAAGVLAVIAAFAMVKIGRRLRWLVEDQRVEQGFGEQESEYLDTLQVTGNEDEAQELLRRHVERTLPSARALVLARNNSADRLEPKTSLDGMPGVREALDGAIPRSCLAVRFGRSHTEGGARTPLMHCDVCGGLPGTSSCEPLLVGGEVIGSVLVNQPAEPSDLHRRRLREAVGQAAPVLGNLRNLAIAELRAATDALTGLPNQRAVQDTLKRMVAQSLRTQTSLAALLLDLDHFKQINDVHGHDRGDEVLAAVGVALRTAVRESDFVGRYGGEEFLVLLPATDQAGAVVLGEALRAAIGAISVPSVDRAITASAGVAVLPQDGGDAVTLFRSADRALYAAKRNGRNRLENASAVDGGAIGQAVEAA